MGPGRLVGEEAGAVDGGVEVGQAVLDRLERADGHAELVALLDVGHPQVEGGPGHAGQRCPSEHPPLVERAGERGPGGVACVEHHSFGHGGAGQR
jgi:hypothetical protein